MPCSSSRYHTRSTRNILLTQPVFYFYAQFIIWRIKLHFRSIYLLSGSRERPRSQRHRKEPRDDHFSANIITKNDTRYIAEIPQSPRIYQLNLVTKRLRDIIQDKVDVKRKIWAKLLIMNRCFFCRIRNHLPTVYFKIIPSMWLTLWYAKVYSKMSRKGVKALNNNGPFVEYRFIITFA